MRSSFVQRLKNQKHSNVVTRESEEKQDFGSIRIKSTSIKNPQKQVTEHCQDIKKLLSILSQVKNPESEANVVKFSEEKKIQQIFQFTEKRKPLQSKKENNNQSQRRVSTFRSVNTKNENFLKSQEFDIQILMNLERKDVDKKQSNKFSSESVNKKSLQFSQQDFPNNRRQNGHSSKFSIIKSQQKQQKKILNQISTKPQVLFFKNQNKKRGLENVGNTCYINSIVQCLFHISSFNSYFAKEEYLQEKKSIVQKFNSDRSIIQKYQQLYNYVIKGISDQGEQKKSASSLKLALSKSCSLFLDWLQEDAHEFLRKLLEAMHQQINRGQKSSPYKLLKTRTKLQYSSISSLADEYFQYYRQKDDSYIYDSFGGQIYNNIKCINCKNQSISFENCLDISLPLIRGKNSLYDLMDEFFGDEKLTDFYRCEFCGQMNKNSTKTTKLWRTPEILIIQLKRSQYGKKNQQPISFPVDFLSMKNYINSESDKLSQKYANYTLKSLVCHRGAVDGGHYWAMIKEFGQWYEINDEKVTKLHYDQTKNHFEKSGSSEAYILFYESLNR